MANIGGLDEEKSTALSSANSSVDFLDFVNFLHRIAPVLCLHPDALATLQRDDMKARRAETGGIPIRVGYVKASPEGEISGVCSVLTFFSSKRSRSIVVLKRDECWSNGVSLRLDFQTYIYSDIQRAVRPGYAEKSKPISLQVYGNHQLLFRSNFTYKSIKAILSIFLFFLEIYML